MTNALVKKTATSIRVEDLGFTTPMPITIVRYHDTDIVIISEHVITLDTGGWFTPTTKRRMNEASKEFNLGFTVYQLDGLWYVRDGEVRYRFVGNKAVISR